MNWLELMADLAKHIRRFNIAQSSMHRRQGSFKGGRSRKRGSINRGVNFTKTPPGKAKAHRRRRNAMAKHSRRVNR